MPALVPERDRRSASLINICYYDADGDRDRDGDHPSSVTECRHAGATAGVTPAMGSTVRLSPGPLSQAISGLRHHHSESRSRRAETRPHREGLCASAVASGGG